MIGQLNDLLNGRKTLILGFGEEGQSTYRTILNFCHGKTVSIADRNPQLAEEFGEELSGRGFSWHFGEDYLENLGEYDLLIKTPGIPVNLVAGYIDRERITSQTDLFLQCFASQVVGITGTKGKSTTSALTHHILSEGGLNALLVGNIGLPPFEIAGKIDDSTIVVFELSSHQLELIRKSPHIAVMLNIFQEHLDFYNSFEAYARAKLNITLHQDRHDYLIYNADDPNLRTLITGGQAFQRHLITFSEKARPENGTLRIAEEIRTFSGAKESGRLDMADRENLPGRHNLRNLMAAVNVAVLKGLQPDLIKKAAMTFVGLPHRLEYAGCFRGIHFYNDSIATIPEATIEAIRTLPGIDTLILGGKDRGVDYADLAHFVSGSAIRNIIFIGDAGKRILALMEAENHTGKIFHVPAGFGEIGGIIRKHTAPGKICLLSPAASSYDMFRNFKERGDTFKKIAREL